MMRVEEPSFDDVGHWLDAPVRQRIVELALAGAHHGMRAEARLILQALPALVPDRETSLCIRAALLIALGDTLAARAALADASVSGQNGAQAADALAHWLEAVSAGRSTGNTRSGLSPATSSSPSLRPSRYDDHLDS
ncbi:MAG: DUF1039 domain-containing protein [Pandoraea sp.]|nr:DUF1039 domain-containing protein [Pandoraea sp.]MDR3400361.1 DUF1039 domain-containing protein [Pandoraea sp.]